MDISTLDSVAAANNGIDVELLHPRTRKPFGLIVHVHGHDSDAYQAVLVDQQRRRTEEASKRGFGALNEAMAPEQIRENADLLIAAAISGWTYRNAEGAVEELTVTEDGQSQPFPYTPKNVRTMFRRWPWAREQIDAAIHDRTRFITD